MLHPSRPRRPTSAKRVRSAPPRLERLEDRCLLATLVGVTVGNNLVRFDSSAPAAVTMVGAISGVAAGQNIVSVDFQPSTDTLYGLGFGASTIQLYTINPTTAAA